MTPHKLFTPVCSAAGEVTMVWYGMVNVNLVHCHAVSNALNTLVAREKPGFQALSKGLI